MNAEINLEREFEFPPYTFCVTTTDQIHKLNCSGIDPELYGNEVDVAMLGLPTLQVFMANNIPIFGGVHLSQRFRQIIPFYLEEEITVKGRLLGISAHPRGCVLRCEFNYANADGTICVAAERSGITPSDTKEPSQRIPRPDENFYGFSEIMRRPLEPQRVADFSNEAGNLIHSDPQVANEHGFRAPIAAGLMGIHISRGDSEAPCPQKL